MHKEQKWYPIKSRIPPINQNKGGCNSCCLAKRLARFAASRFAMDAGESFLPVCAEERSAFCLSLITCPLVVPYVGSALRLAARVALLLAISSGLFLKASGLASRFASLFTFLVVRIRVLTSGVILRPRFVSRAASTLGVIHSGSCLRASGLDWSFTALLARRDAALFALCSGVCFLPMLEGGELRSAVGFILYSGQMRSIKSCSLSTSLEAS